MARTTKYLSRTLNTSINSSGVSNVVSFSYSELYYTAPPSKIVRVDVLGYAFSQRVYMGPSFVYSYAGSLSYDATVGNMSMGLYHGLTERSFSGIFSALSWNVNWASYYNEGGMYVGAPIFNLQASAKFGTVAGHFGTVPGVQRTASQVATAGISGPSIVNYAWSDYGNFHGNFHPAHAGQHGRSTTFKLMPSYYSFGSASYVITSTTAWGQMTTFGGVPTNPGLWSNLMSGSTSYAASYLSSVGNKRHFYLGAGESLYINFSAYLSTAGVGKTLNNVTSISYSFNFLITEEDI